MRSLLLFNTRVIFGPGVRAELPDELTRLRMRRPLYVTDRGVVGAGVFEQAVPTPPAAVFDATPPNPTEAAAEAGFGAYRAGGCDSIVGVGGGAALDLAKAIAVLAGDEAPLWEYCNRHPDPRPIFDPPPLILIPTTSGSGSEVGRSAVIVFRNGTKAGIGCPSIVKAALCDPELTLRLPPLMTAATGMDALSHCIETYCSPAYNPPADAIVRDGLARLCGSLERAVQDGSDLGARTEMMMGAIEGAIGFQKGLGAVHALSHPLGALGHHHGTLNAILLPAVLEANREAIGQKWTHLANTMGLAAQVLPDGVRALNARLGLPPGLAALGVEPGALPGLARAALEDNAHKTNPRPLSEADYTAILQAAM